MTTVFIAQPWQGRTEEEVIRERCAIADKLRQIYGEIEIIANFSPALNAINGPIAVRAFAKEVEMLSDARVAAFGPGWSGDRGCRALHVVCKAFGMTVVEYGSLG